MIRVNALVIWWLVWLPGGFLVAEQPAVNPVGEDHAAVMEEGLKLFRDHVREILVENCVRCHGGDFIESGFDLSSRDALMKGGASGEPGIVPGDADASLAFGLMTHRREPAMPQEASRLKAEQLDLVADWIRLGAPYDSSLIDSGQVEDWTARVVKADAKEYWAFRPLQSVLPPGNDSRWGRGPIDSFVLTGLAAAGLEPNPEADKRTLIRRAHFGVIGIPPGTDDVSAFLADDSDDAYASLVDRLLSSPQFGERWARHWLDVARFAESHGFEQDYDRPHAYHFRDFVIKAFNQDMPYDQFVRYQLAGDEIAPDDPLAMMATGFLGAGVYPTQITLREVEPSRYDALDDMANVTGQAFLGLTVGCARCHDHKFDPIPQADYSRFIATFALTVRSNVDVQIAPADAGEIANHKAKRDEMVAALEAFEQQELPGRLDSWMVAQDQEGVAEDVWSLLPWTARSDGGATMALQDDGSFLVNGTNPDFDRYAFVAETHLSNLSAIRIEALTDASMVASGPGRADNGNFCLTDVRVVARSVVDPKNVMEVKLIDPRATHQQDQSGLSVAASIDGNRATGWAVDFGGIGKDQAAEFRFASPVGFPGGTVLEVALEFNGNGRHSLGRPRISVTNATEPIDLGAPAVMAPPGDLVSGIEMRAGIAGLDEQQKKALLRWYRDRDPRWRELSGAIDHHDRNPPSPKVETVMVASEGVTPIRHHMPGGAPDFFEKTYYLRRGDVLQKEGEAQPGFLQVLVNSDDSPSRWQVTPPEGSSTSHRRRAMADWMTDTECGAGHLLARVIVNRIWHYHFGQGLVATPNDFGRQAEPPSHPELLDYLAQSLIDGGWRLKPIHKMILTSAAYRQSSAFNDKSSLVDPLNRLVWRYTPRRLEAEVIRDSLLAVTRSLDTRMYGPGTLDESMRRRGIYFTTKRSQLVSMLQLFDAPESLGPLGNRSITTVGPQSLWFLNNAHVRTWASEYAAKIIDQHAGSPSAAVDEVYQDALSRLPAPKERHLATAFLASQADAYRDSGESSPERLAMTDLCQAILSLNEFIYVE
jgi:mono/diheme cytochrome c family protein